MHYLTNYYKNLSEQLQEKVNFLESQLNEYLVRPGEKDGKKGTFYGPKFVPDEGGKKGMLSPLPFTSPKPDPKLRTETKPSKPGIQITPQRKPLIGKVPGLADTDAIDKVPMLGDTDAINVMPEPDRDEINITPEFGQRGPVRPSRPYDFLNNDPKSKQPRIPAKKTPNYEPRKLDGSGAPDAVKKAWNTQGRI